MCSACNPQPAPAENSDGFAECVVMPGTRVDKAQAEEAGLYRDRDGNRYWLCCAGCGPAFDADPDRYVTS